MINFTQKKTILLKNILLNSQLCHSVVYHKKYKCKQAIDEI